jgi:outer membrane protein TolC
MNKDILIKQREIKKAEIKKAELDLVLETAEAYMAVLKVESSAKIQKNNLELTKRNLELAKERKEAGISGQADIYRFESELSKSISSLVETMLNIDIAKTNLKRIINYNLQQPLELVNIDFNSGDFLTSNSEFFKYISNQNNTNLLIDFMHEMAMKSSTDLKKIDYGVEIQKRLIKNTKNKKFIPTIALQANYSINNIIAEGAGSSYPDFGTIIGAFGNPDEFNWSVALGFSLPIYTGGELKIDKKIAENSIEVLELQKDTTQKNIDQQIITSISKVVTEYSKIKNAEISLTSALKALNIVKESYSSGITSIFDLISSQNAAFSAEEYKSTITYDLMTAIMRTERVLEEFYILKSDEEKAEISKKIDLINK